MKSFFTALPLLAATVSAHTTFQALWVDGVADGKMETSAIRHNWQDGQSNFPLTDVTQANIACNKWATAPAAKKASIKAGSKVTAEWHHEPVQRAGDADEPIALSHKGPIMAYLGKVDDSATASVDGVKWFKIFEDTKDSAGTWAVERFYNNKGMIDFTIPSCVANGDYFLRVEIIGLHEADRANGAQLYPECAQISITGGGTASPATVSFPGAYIQNGVGLSYNLYSGNAPYTAPGPSVFTCGAGGNSPAPAPSSSQPASSATAPAPSTLSTTTRAASTPAATLSGVTTVSAPASSAGPSSTRAASTTRAATVTTRAATSYSAAPTTSVENIPAPSSSAAPQPSSPSTPGVPTREEIESFFTSVLALYDQWKAGN